MSDREALSHQSTRGNATVVVELRLNDIDLRGVETWVRYIHETLAGALHQAVDARPGVGCDVRNVTWEPRDG